VVELPDGAEPPKLGEVVAVVPNHVCPVVNLARELVVTRAAAVVDVWPIDGRG
jgi:D-serine deaminase-like pyridoxal phosphate-dependent protein